MSWICRERRSCYGNMFQIIQYLDPAHYTESICAFWHALFQKYEFCFMFVFHSHKSTFAGESKSLNNFNQFGRKIYHTCWLQYHVTDSAMQFLSAEHGSSGNFTSFNIFNVTQICKILNLRLLELLWLIIKYFLGILNEKTQYNLIYSFDCCTTSCYDVRRYLLYVDSMLICVCCVWMCHIMCISVI